MLKQPVGLNVWNKFKGVGTTIFLSNKIGESKVHLPLHEQDWVMTSVFGKGVSQWGRNINCFCNCGQSKKILKPLILVILSLIATISYNVPS